jgi:hypothetical protein
MQRAVDAISQFPMRCEYTTKNKYIHNGLPTVMELSGTATFTDGPRSRTELIGIAYPASDPTATAEVSIVTVLDGSYEWWKTDSSSAASPTVTKSPMKSTEEFPALVSQVIELATDYELEIVDQAHNRVVLEGSHSEVAYRARIVLDEASAQPLEIQLGTGSESIHMTFLEWKILESVDSDIFTYIPPEGVTVQLLPGKPGE